MDFVIADIIQHGPTVKEFHLRRTDGAPLAEWQAGAHVVLHLSAADGAT